ncbi:MAG TPA: leucine-rich repeat domain-containing protein [Cyclobacteriaceae bacterium]|nr:leucine-rich repeat domain-containing protein [Cyclobacteriaceae bacterium]
MKLKLPAVINTMLKKRGAIVDPALRASRAQLVDTCTSRCYKPHAGVLAFEAAFGGLLIPDGPKMKKDEPSWIFGAHACLTTGGHVDPRGGSKARKLVPVVCSPNDIIYFLDEQGRGYAQDTIEDVSAVRFSGNGKSLVCRIVLQDALFSRNETSLELPGLQGKELSKKLSLKVIKEASDNERVFYSDKNGDVIVVEETNAKRTVFAGATKKQLGLVQRPVDKNAAKLPAELVPFIGKEMVRMAFEQRTSLPEFLEQLPDLRELDVSGNKLETLPESLWRTTQLTKLDLSFNPLKAIPGGIGNLKKLRSLHLRRCPIVTLPDALVGATSLTKLVVTECEDLNVDMALQVIARLKSLKELSLPLSHSLTSLAPLAQLKLKSLELNGIYMKRSSRLPPGLGQLKTLEDLRIQYADEVAELPEAPGDVRALRLIFSKRFTDDDIRKSIAKQPEVLYLQAYVKTL